MECTNRIVESRIWWCPGDTTSICTECSNITTLNSPKKVYGWSGTYKTNIYIIYICKYTNIYNINIQYNNNILVYLLKVVIYDGYTLLVSTSRWSNLKVHNTWGIIIFFVWRFKIFFWLFYFNFTNIYIIKLGINYWYLY